MDKPTPPKKTMKEAMQNAASTSLMLSDEDIALAMQSAKERKARNLASESKSRPPIVPETQAQASSCMTKNEETPKKTMKEAMQNAASISFLMSEEDMISAMLSPEEQEANRLGLPMKSRPPIAPETQAQASS